MLELYKNDNGIKTQLSIMIPTDKLVFQKSIDGFNSEISISAIFVNDYKIIANESWNYKKYKLKNHTLSNETKSCMSFYRN